MEHIMGQLILLCLTATLTITQGMCTNGTSKKYSPLKVPEGFKFGVASSAYQIEGAWNVSGRSLSIWDVFTRIPGTIKDNSTGEDACKSYEFWERDIKMLKYLGVNLYRFSISWPRLLPTGYSNNISETALQYYNNVIDALVQAGIEPAVTIYHGDLPENFQKLGGWANSLSSDWLEDFARVLFENFGDRVKTWFTVNEPLMTGAHAYGDKSNAPGVNAHGFGEYITAKTMLMAHARVYRLYNDTYRPEQKGIIGLVKLTDYDAPLTNSVNDRLAASDAMEFDNGLYLDPIFSKNGGFPERVVDLVAKRSAEQGYSRSRLSQLSDDEKAYIKGTSDFLGVNYYTQAENYTREGFSTGMYPIPSRQDDMGVIGGDNDFQFKGDEMPTGLRKTLLWLKERYNNPPIIITENGYLEGTVGLYDTDRLTYQKKHLYTVLNSTINDGINIKGYVIWSLMDDFEWTSGYTVRLGMYETDFSADNRTRTLRLSGCWYRDVILSGIVDLNYIPKCNNVSF